MFPTFTQAASIFSKCGSPAFFCNCQKRSGTFYQIERIALIKQKTGIESWVFGFFSDICLALQPFLFSTPHELLVAIL